MVATARPVVVVGADVVAVVSETLVVPESSAVVGEVVVELAEATTDPSSDVPRAHTSMAATSRDHHCTRLQ
jgi:hypothetical protein